MQLHRLLTVLSISSVPACLHRYNTGDTVLMTTGRWACTPFTACAALHAAALVADCDQHQQHTRMPAQMQSGDAVSITTGKMHL